MNGASHEVAVLLGSDDTDGPDSDAARSARQVAGQVLTPISRDWVHFCAYLDAKKINQRFLSLK